ncbi:MAG: hypothetical protein M1812_002527 [Candelaria pacifica]|nr:MAG: hypothetical protein M1812_002527 [Candelaria pacifica]
MSHATAKINNSTIADAQKWEVVEGNIYFPPSSVDSSYISKSDTTTWCPWKGTAHYYNIKVDGNELKDAAWYYPEPKEKAENIRDHVAFDKATAEITSE